jgi:hypothetical protein
MTKRGRPFKKGNQLGRGRPRGSRNERTLTVKQKLDESSSAILDKAIALAREGDAPMLRLLVPYLLPRSNDVPVKMGPLPMGTLEEISQTTAVTLDRVASGKITPGQAQQVFTWAEERRKLIEGQEMQNRVSALEGFKRRA